MHTDLQKRIRALQKKLQQIAVLKGKAAEGAVLDPDQVKKIESEASIQQEIQELGGTM